VARAMGRRQTHPFAVLVTLGSKRLLSLKAQEAQDWFASPSSVRSKIWDFSFGQAKQCPLAPLYKNLSNPSCNAVFTCLNRSRSSRVNLFSFSHARLLRSQVSPSLLCVTFRSGHILVHVSSPYSAFGWD
jgi:hypothetical protein